MSKHAQISYAKSIIRITGYINLLISVPCGVGLLILAEVLGILEELYEKQ